MRKILYSALVLLTLASCTKKEETAVANENYPTDGKVRISTSINELNSSTEVASATYTGSDLSLTIDYGNNDRYTNTNIRCELSGDQTWLPGTELLWKNATTSAKIYAYAPFVSGLNVNAVPFSIKTDQRTGLVSSDLVGYVNTDFVPGSNLTQKQAVDIVFEHKLAKLTIDIFFSDQLPAASIKEVKILTQISTIYNAINGTVSPASSNIGDISAYNVKNNTYEAILPPQTITTGSQMIVIELNDGRKFAYTVPAGGHTFLSGEAYNMTLKVGKDRITIDDITVADWNTGTPISNEGDVIKLDVVTIPAGEFMMGSPDGEAGRLDNEDQYKVTLTKSFLMSKYEITAAQYCEFLNAKRIPGAAYGITVTFDVEGYGNQPLFRVNFNMNGSPEWNAATVKWECKSKYRKYPMYWVSWYGAKAFADWIGGALPTEAQWEYACRAGTTTAFSFGADATDINAYCWYTNNNPGGSRYDVGSRLPNSWGLYDMHGSNSEWCSDFYDFEHPSYPTEPQTDPTGPSPSVHTTSRVVRGGHTLSGAAGCRSAARDKERPADINGNGFRVIIPIH